MRSFYTNENVVLADNQRELFGKLKAMNLKEFVRATGPQFVMISNGLYNLFETSILSIVVEVN